MDVRVWTIKKAECRRVDAFELWCWKRLLRVPWTARRSNQSILKEISSEYSLEGLMLKLKLQYFGHLRWRADSLENLLMLGKTEGRRRGGQKTRWLDGLTDSTDMSLSKLGKIVKDREAWHAAVHGVTKSWTWLSDWTTTTIQLTRILCVCVCVCVCVGAQSCPTLFDPINYSPWGSSVHGIFPGKNTGVGAISHSRGSSWPQNRTRVSCVSCTGRRILYHKCHLWSPTIISTNGKTETTT